MNIDIKVNEQRAPTDQSVKLLMEMEDAAKKKIEQSISIGDNGFTCVVHIWKDNLEDCQAAQATFSLNGIKMNATAKVHGYEKYDKVVLFRRLTDAVATVIAKEVLIAAINQGLQNH